MRTNNVKDAETGTEAEQTISELPPWFDKGCSRPDIFKSDSKNPAALSILLNGVRQDMYTALSLYQVHVKFISTLVISLLTVIGAIFSILKLMEISQPAMRMIEVGTSILLLVAFMIGLLSLIVVTRYYKVYVSALLFAAQMHYEARISGFFWFEKLIELLKKKFLEEGSITKEEFIASRTWSRRDTHFWYVIFITLLSIVCVGASIFILINAPFSYNLSDKSYLV